jgi:hypothetical protein
MQRLLPKMRQLLGELVQQMTASGRWNSKRGRMRDTIRRYRTDADIV